MWGSKEYIVSIYWLVLETFFIILNFMNSAAWNPNYCLSVGLILCGIMSSDELVNTVVCICAPLIFLQAIQGTEKGARQRLNSSIHVHALVLQKPWISLWEWKPVTSSNDSLVQMIILESLSPVVALETIILSILAIS